MAISSLYSAIKGQPNRDLLMDILRHIDWKLDLWHDLYDLECNSEARIFFILEKEELAIFVNFLSSYFKIYSPTEQEKVLQIFFRKYCRQYFPCLSDFTVSIHSTYLRVQVDVEFDFDAVQYFQSKNSKNQLAI